MTGTAANLIRPDGTLRGIYRSGGKLYLRLSSPGRVIFRPVDAASLATTYAALVGELATAKGITDPIELEAMHGTFNAFARQRSRTKTNQGAAS